jgi:glycosyltransferase involved in cell wall biosynthesis
MSSTKLMKISGLVRQNSGVGWYRIVQPLMAAYKKGVEISSTKFTGTNEVATIGETQSGGPYIDDPTLMKICKNADVIWTTLIYDYDEIVKVLDLRKWSGAKLIVDLDDDIYHVSHNNPMKKYADKASKNMVMFLSMVDGVTVSVPKLKREYEIINPNIYVNPNGQNLDTWPKKVHKPHKGIRIGYRGASGHQADVALIEPAIKALSKDYDVTLVTMGVENKIKSEHHPWVNCMDFQEEFAKLDIDIGIVPLIDDEYNKCKSNIAVQEFGALKIPVIASPVENQKDMPGVLYAKNNSEWYDQIEKLIKNKKLRKQMGESLYNHVKKEWSVDKFTPELLKWMENLPKKDIKG